MTKTPAEKRTSQNPAALVLREKAWPVRPLKSEAMEATSFHVAFKLFSSTYLVDDGETIKPFIPRAVLGSLLKSRQKRMGKFFGEGMCGGTWTGASVLRPWGFSRVFLIMILTAVVLFAVAYLLYVPRFLPEILMVSAFAVPFTLVVFLGDKCSEGETPFRLGADVFCR